MAKKPRNIRQLTNYMKRVNDVYLAAHMDTLMRITLDAQKRTIQNEKKEFTGRGGRKLSGNLMRKTHVAFEGDFRRTKNIKRMPRGFVVVATPYAAINEFGGEITPKKAKNLWIRLEHRGRFKRISPTEFMKNKKKAETRRRSQGRLIRKGLATALGSTSKASKKIKTEDWLFLPGKNPNTVVAAYAVRQKRGWKYTPLFALAKRVKIPSRPYVAPAIDSALKFYGAKYSRSLAGLVAKRFIGRN